MHTGGRILPTGRGRCEHNARKVFRFAFVPHHNSASLTRARMGSTFQPGCGASPAAPPWSKTGGRCFVLQLAIVPAAHLGPRKDAHEPKSQLALSCQSPKTRCRLARRSESLHICVYWSGLLGKFSATLCDVLVLGHPDVALVRRSGIIIHVEFAIFFESKHKNTGKPRSAPSFIGREKSAVSGG